MKVELLQLVKEQILKEPEQFDMMMWFQTAPSLRRPVPNCGTAACIGGWAMAISQGISPREADNMRVFKQSDASRVLGLSLAEGTRLFHVMAWPIDFKSAFIQEEDNTLEGLQARARIAAARIDHFIATNGRE
jgi:hypothetical protein